MPANDPEFGHRQILREKLAQWRASFDRVVLALIADEHQALDAVVLRGLQKLIHRPRRQQTGFINEPKLGAAFGGAGRDRFGADGACLGPAGPGAGDVARAPGPAAPPPGGSGALGSSLAGSTG